jgi:putative SOS response-associated peptidase YedK
MIITEPNESAAEIHDRTPVFLAQEQFALWLSGDAGANYLKPVPNDYLQRWPVSKRVNSSKADADDATLTDKVELAVAWVLLPAYNTSKSLSGNIILDCIAFEA